MNMFTLKVFKCGGTSNPSYYLLTKKVYRQIFNILVGTYLIVVLWDLSTQCNLRLKIFFSCELF